MNNRTANNLVLFFLGLGTSTQIHVVGSIAITELVAFFVAPFMFMKDVHILRKNGFLPFVVLTLLTCLGGLISGWVNHTFYIFLLKGIASPYSIFSLCVVIHHFLRKDLSGLRWLLFGCFLSSIVCVFVFQQEVYTFREGYLAEGSDATSLVINYPLFWSTRITHALLLPVMCCYLTSPAIYNSVAPFVSFFVRLFLSEGSGRSAALVAFFAGIIILLGGKRTRQMGVIGRHFFLILLVLLGILAAGKQVYVLAVTKGWLGDLAQDKYYRQTAGQSGFMSIIMGGRLEFFTAVRACLDRPIIGFGAKPFDHNHYYERMLEKFGTEEDYAQYLKSMYTDIRNINTEHFIPAHSQIASFWLQYGVMGLILWIYVLVMFYKLYKKYSFVIPQWYGYFAVTITSSLWDIFFSPFGDRYVVSILMSCILFARAVATGRMILPMSMMLEINSKCR